jgi:hypothetical protein
LKKYHRERVVDEILGELQSGSPPRSPTPSPKVSMLRFSRVPSGSRPSWQDDDGSLAGRQIPEPFRSPEEEDSADFGYAGIRKKTHRTRQQQAEVDESPQLKRKKGIPIRMNRAPEEVPQAHPMQLLTQRRQIAPARPKLEIQFVQGLAFGVDNEDEASLPKSRANIDELASESEGDDNELHRTQEPPEEEEEEEDEVDNDATIRRFFDGRTIPMIHLSDDDDKVIIGHSDIDISGLEMNLCDWSGGVNDDAEESAGERYFDI